MVLVALVCVSSCFCGVWTVVDLNRAGLTNGQQMADKQGRWEKDGCGHASTSHCQVVLLLGRVFVLTAGVCVALLLCGVRVISAFSRMHERVGGAALAWSVFISGLLAVFTWGQVGMSCAGSQRGCSSRGGTGALTCVAGAWLPLCGGCWGLALR